jgi:hypothetical protein
MICVIDLEKEVIVCCDEIREREEEEGEMDQGIYVRKKVNESNSAMTNDW